MKVYKHTLRSSLWASLLVVFIAGCGAYTQTAKNIRVVSAKTIVNPVAPEGHDPWVMQKDGKYYYLYSHEGSIWLNQHDLLQEAVQFAGQIIWTPPKGTEYSEEIWAPEIFFIDDHWYVYFAADDGDNANHRMYVLKSKTANPYSEYEFVGKLADASDKWAIDGTLLQHQQKLYFIWSGWEGDKNVQQNIYIAEMDSPTTIASHRVLISQPDYLWEKVGTPLVNEGPQILKNAAGDVFIIYSASGSWTDSYALGQLRLSGNDPLIAESWVKHPEAVFSSTDKVFSPGHASFTKSPDGSEDWIVYHTAKFKGAGWNRDVNMKEFTWDKQGNPIFSQPTEKGLVVPAPSHTQQ